MRNIAEQFEDLYSKWSLLDNVAKEAQLPDMICRTQRMYQFLVITYNRKGFLTLDEYRWVEQVRQIGQYMLSQKIHAAQDLWNEMMKQLAKMSMNK